MSHNTRFIKLPHSNARLHTLNRGAMRGRGYGTVLLDNGMGGQSSYHSIEDYEKTTGVKLPLPESTKTEGRSLNSIIGIKQSPQGQGLADKISAKLAKLHIAPPTMKPKRKNITLSF